MFQLCLLQVAPSAVTGAWRPLGQLGLSFHVLSSARSSPRPREDEMGAVGMLVD